MSSDAKTEVICRVRDLLYASRSSIEVRPARLNDGPIRFVEIADNGKVIEMTTSVARKVADALKYVADVIDEDKAGS